MSVLKSIVAAFLAALDLSVPPLAQAEDGEEGAMVRMAHLSPDTPRGDIYLDGKPIGSPRDVRYGAVSGYPPLPKTGARARASASSLPRPARAAEGERPSRRNRSG